MKIRKLSALLLSLAMLLGLLAGCGGGDEAEITAEDFYGCWEYADYDMWVCFYDDGTFEWYSDGLDSTGTYSMDGVELHLDDDSERFFVTDGEGGLMDWDGDALFASELPDTWDDEEGLGAPDYEPEVNFEDFFGCWEYWDYDIWLYVYGDGTYEMYNENGDCTAGSYTPEGTEIVLDSGERFALDGEGGLIDEDGDTLFPTELPDFTPVAYFEEGGYSFDLEMDEGRFPLENAVRYSYEDGSSYTTAYGEWALNSISDQIVNDQYRDVIFEAVCYFPTSSDPGLSGRYTIGCMSELFDYYTGEWLPMASVSGDSTAEENTYSYTLNIDGEEVRLDYMKSLSWEHNVGDCSNILYMTITVRMPVDYDGLVFCASPSPYTYEELTAHHHEGEGYVTGMTLEERTGIDEDNALFCRIW